MARYIFPSESDGVQRPTRSGDTTADPVEISDDGVTLLGVTAAAPVANITDSATGTQIATAVNGILAALRAAGIVRN